MSSASGAVIDNRAESRLKLAVGEQTAVAYYREENGRIVLSHTEVPPELSGRRVGTRSRN